MNATTRNDERPRQAAKDHAIRNLRHYQRTGQRQPLREGIESALDLGVNWTPEECGETWVEGLIKLVEEQS